MKNFFSFLSIEKIKHRLHHTTKRFPMAVGVSIVFCAILFILLHGNNPDSSIATYLIRAVFSLVIVFFLSIGSVLYRESEDISKNISLLYQIAPVVFGVLFFLSFHVDIDNFQNFTFFIITLTGITSLLFFSPYIKNIFHNSGEPSVYYGFFYTMSSVFLVSAILGGILFGLGAIGITAVFELFDIGYGWSEIYGDWAIVALGFCAPVFALTQMPTKESFTKSVSQQNTFFSFLVQYVAIPFILIYFIILYAYTIKVLLHFSSWPKGEVSWLVIGFSAFGYVIYIFSYIFESKNYLIKLFRKYFPYVVIPQVAMLFYAIFLRIGQYDITVNRYFVVVFGLWLLVISVYFIFSQKKYLGYIPAVITLFTIIISIGPWSVYNLPESRQLERLKDNLESANILREGTIIPLESIDDISAELSGDIYDGIQYICNLGDCESIIKLFPEQHQQLLQKIQQEYESRSETGVSMTDFDVGEPSKWEIISHITNSIKVQRYYNNSTIPIRYMSYYIDYKESIFPLDISDYMTLHTITSHTDISQTGIHMRINPLSQEAFLYDGARLIETSDISDIIESIKKLPEGQVPMSDLVFEREETKLIITSIHIPNTQYESENTDSAYYDVSGYLLAK